MTKKEVLLLLRQELLKKYVLSEADRIARMLICWKLSCTQAELLIQADTLISKEYQEQLFSLVHEHLETSKPLQYSMGSVPFLGTRITVRPPVLIPRPETELMCQYAIEQLKMLNQPKLTLLDLCTGSGCIALGLASAFKEASITAIDKAPHAVALARENSLAQKCSQIEVLRSDLFSALPLMKFDAIISNPPYVSQSEWDHLDAGITEWEDPAACIAGKDGLDLLKEIIAQAPRWLTFEKNRRVPQLILECGETHAHEVARLMERAGFTAQVQKDDAGKDRFVTGILVGETP